MASQRTDLSERLEALIAHSPDIVVATDKSGTIIFYNDGASATLGYSTEEILGQPVTTVYPSRDEARRVMKVMRGPEGGGAGVVTNLPTHFQAKNGDEIPVAISGTLVLDAEGKEDGTIGFAKDLREILHNEEQAVLGQVAVGLAHEIRNPLAVVVNQAELLEGELYDLAGERDCSVENERIDAIRREVARISEIVEQLGEMARTDSYETVDYVGPSRMVDLRKVREPGGDPRLKGLRILVCDDDGGICRSLGEILEADGCIVDTASDGQEALDRIRANPGEVDLLLSDVMMPKMDGYDLYQAVRREYPDLPVLMMTAFHYDKDHVIKRSRIDGLDGVVFKKPVDPARLRDAICEAVKR